MGERIVRSGLGNAYKSCGKLDTTVNVLLGETVETKETTEIQILATKLELLNEQFAKQNETRRKIWRTFFIILGALALTLVVKELIGYIHFVNAMGKINSGTNIGGIVAPTDVYVINGIINISEMIIAVVFAVASGIGTYRTRRI